MSNQFPDLAVRQAIFALLTPIGVPIYDMRVPKDADTPNTYIILETQTERQHSTNKCGHLWASSILIDAVVTQNQGFSNREPLDNLCAGINAAIDLSSGDISISGFEVMNTQIQDSHDITIDTPTQTTNRKLMRYQFVLMQAA